MKKLLLPICLLLTAAVCRADISPKPEMEFSFIYNTQARPLVDPAHSEQFQCNDNQCTDPHPLGHYGIQKLYCSPGSCFSVAYEYDDFQRLVLAFTDGTQRTSNIFPAPHTLRARFNVYIDEDKLTVEPSDLVPDASAWARTDAWVSLLLILLLELGAAAAYLIYTHKPFCVLYSVAAANIITTLVAWLFLAWYSTESSLLWVFCVLVETLIIRLANLKRMSLWEAFVLTLAMNVTSYSLGMIISFWLAPLLF